MVARPEGTSVAKGPQAPLDTLAQLGQTGVTSDAERLVRRARAKFMTFPLAVALAEERSPLEQSYRNSVYCASTLEQDENGKLCGRYCGNRWCLVCNRVRSARALNKYLPVLATWSDPHLVTLTLPNVDAEALGATLDEMLDDVRAIGRAIKRTDALPFRALRKLECTYNARRNDFHPHFHLVVEGAAQAEALRSRWLDRHPDASPSAQDSRPCDAKALKEMFKYFTKLIANRSVAPVWALDRIFCAMKGRRVFQPMGFKVETPASDDENGEIGTEGDTSSNLRPGETLTWEWIQGAHDWIDTTTGETLAGYAPTDGFRELVDSIQKSVSKGAIE